MRRAVYKDMYHCQQKYDYLLESMDDQLLSLEFCDAVDVGLFEAGARYLDEFHLLAELLGKMGSTLRL